MFLKRKKNKKTKINLKPNNPEDKTSLIFQEMFHGKEIVLILVCAKDAQRRLPCWSSN